MLVGLPKSTLSQMAHPKGGVASRSEFFSLALVSKWLADFGPQPAFNPLPHVEPDPPLSDEEKARRDEMVAKLQAELKATTEKMRRSGRISGTHKPLAPKQVDDAEARMRALETLEEARGYRGVPHRHSA